MIKRVLSGLFLVFIVLNSAFGATLLPNGEQAFVDANGQPLAYGSVQFYVPGTTTPKNTWSNSAQTALNTNPVKLDGSGRAIIYGSGVYRQVVSDVNGVLIWDQQTADTSANNFSWASFSGGSANAQTLAAPNFTNADGQEIAFLASFTNTGALTFTINGGTPINVVKDTNSGPIALTGGEVISGNQYQLVYDASIGEFHLVTFPNVPGIGAPLPLAAAATTDLGTISSHDVSITGSATITSFGATASIATPFYIIQPAGTSTITAGASIKTPSGGNITTSAGDSGLLLYEGAGVWQILSYSSQGVPSNAVMSFNATTCPVGWIPSDGTNGTADVRGYFVRGLDTGGAVDPSRTLASTQQDQLHTFAGSVGSGLNGTVSGGGTLTVGATINGQSVTFSGATFGSETRPKNVALLYCQKQ